MRSLCHFEQKSILHGLWVRKLHQGAPQGVGFAILDNQPWELAPGWPRKMERKLLVCSMFLLYGHFLLLLSNVLGVSLYHLRSILLDHGECTYPQEMVHLQLC